jgi:hypothetical protein
MPGGHSADLRGESLRNSDGDPTCDYSIARSGLSKTRHMAEALLGVKDAAERARADALWTSAVRRL